ncbi:BgTH12-07214 [Blumeria graminis f. sp. triticale]|uniref:BgTH12-07214 n=1 Tax=Blumeria graminis f. sp. triticale TaxID=1689686 RepID=A0A9W4GI58_BLUGR|nr:BgTH12-07214 [Blumeria graminis f. sp. triticale]
MSSPNFKLGYCRIESTEKLFFSVLCSLSAEFVPFTNKISFLSVLLEFHA